MKVHSIFLVFILVFFRLTVIGQVAIIKDKDGYTNVRSGPGTNSKIICKVLENEVFFYDTEAVHYTNWIPVYVPIDKFSLSESQNGYVEGFVHKSRIQPIYDLKPYTGKNFLFKYVLKPFNEESHTIDYIEQKWVDKIDGRKFWGTDGGVPDTEVSEIEVNYLGNRIKVEKPLYSDLFQVNEAFQVYQNENTFFVIQWNSDGAGAYSLVWVFEEDKLKQRIIGSFY